MLPSIPLEIPHENNLYVLQGHLKSGQIGETVNVTSPCEPSGRILSLNRSDFDTPCLDSSNNFILNSVSHLLELG